MVYTVHIFTSLIKENIAPYILPQDGAGQEMGQNPGQLGHGTSRPKSTRPV